MDNITHALAGSLIAAAGLTLAERTTRQNTVGTSLRATVPAQPVAFRRAAFVLGIVAAELPDADLLYAGGALGMGPLGYLLHHRGHTHTVLFAVVAAIALWGIALLCWRTLRAPPWRAPLLAIALAGTLSHLLLDFTNNYGVHPFWPVHNAWWYGDAVFIVEPWLWIAAIPALYLGTDSRTRRILLAVLLPLVIVLGLATRVLGVDIALVMALGLAAVVVASRAASRRWLPWVGIGAWCAVEAVFFAASHQAREQVMRGAGESLTGGLAAGGSPAEDSQAGVFRVHDVALTPSAGNPLCFTALVVESDGTTYRVSSAQVATVPGARTSQQCARTMPLPSAQARGSTGSTASSRVMTAALRWTDSWSAPVAELVALAATNCEVAAAVQFLRVPAWRRGANGDIELFDLRFGARGFAAFTVRANPAPCPRYVPGWTPPRADIFAFPFSINTRSS